MAAGISQSLMADFMLIPVRTYENLANGTSPIRGIHIRAALFAILIAADEMADPTIIRYKDRTMILRLADLIKERFN